MIDKRWNMAFLQINDWLNDDDQDKIVNMMFHMKSVQMIDKRWLIQTNNDWS